MTDIQDTTIVPPSVPYGQETTRPLRKGPGKRFFPLRWIAPTVRVDMDGRQYETKRPYVKYARIKFPPWTRLTPKHERVGAVRRQLQREMKAC